MKFMVQSKGHGKVIVQVDEQDAHLLREHVWHVHMNEGQTYLRRVQRVGVTIALHREIMQASKDEIVRFRNGDQLDMRRANLVKEPYAVAQAFLASQMLAVSALYRVAHV